jgi:hypothetical protein
MRSSTFLLRSATAPGRVSASGESLVSICNWPP